jgi:iron complex outermembrane receptor protein
MRITQLDASNVGLTTSSAFVLVPKWNASASIAREFSLGAMGTLTPRFDWTFRSGTYMNSNGLPTMYQSGYSVFNTAVRWEKGKLNVTAGVDNLANKRYAIFGDDPPALAITCSPSIAGGSGM